MADERPIIIKRIKKSGGGHHGGAWKVAYADFVTAMMAFFLLLWLLSATTEAQKKGLADYFDPTIAIAASQASSVAIMDGQPQVMETMSGAAAAQADIEGEDEESTKGKDAEPVEATEDGAKPVDQQEAEAAVRAKEQQRFEQVKEKIEQVIDQSPELSGLKDNLQIDQTPEGLRIQLLDKEKESMFASGSAQLEERTQKLLALVGQAVKDMPNKLAISGHTDATHELGIVQRPRQCRTARAGAGRRRPDQDRHRQRPRRYRALHCRESGRPAQPAHLDCPP